MALARSVDAIAAVDEMLRSQLTLRTSAATVAVGRPESAATQGERRLNLFLYQTDIDGHLRHQPIDPGQRPPIWLQLRYLLTAFDTAGDSDSVAAHGLLGEGLLALAELNFLRPTVPELNDNPEPLKITFDHGDVDLLSKIMQGSEEAYRMSAAFSLRPVPIFATAPPSYAPAVRTIGPPGAEGVVVLPNLGPRLDRVAPADFEGGDVLTLTGSGIGGTDVEVCFNDVCLPPDLATDTQVTITVPVPPATAPGPGAQAIAVVRVLPSGRRFSSNAVVGRLRPTLLGAAAGALTPSGPNLFGDLTLTGERLGGPDDDIFVAFYRAGEVARMLPASGIAAQNSLNVPVLEDDAIPPGSYRIILRVNAVQAANAPEVSWA
jgi:hypothetical protein